MDTRGVYKCISLARFLRHRGTEHPCPKLLGNLLHVLLEWMIGARSNTK